MAFLDRANFGGEAIEPVVKQSGDTFASIHTDLGDRAA